MLTLLLTGAAPAKAQTTLTGTVTDSLRQPVVGALLEVQNPRQPAESAVAVADAQGRFSVRVAFATDSLLLSVRSLGFREQARRLPNRNQTLRFELKASSFALREVVVQAPPIRQQGDTLSYRVSAFSDPKDRVIADVLKKMPGVEVEADGRILFEGRPIQKLYVNGADLLEGRYSLASNNLPADAVQDVQVLRRHQPVRALAGAVPTEQASLNLQLKKKVTATGQARAGAGARPALWNVNLTPMLFAPGHQLLDTYQTNNTGQDAAAELRPLGGEDLRQLANAAAYKPELTGIQRLGMPPLAASRYLFNQVHLLAANHLLPLSKDTQLRVNASYLHDEQRQAGQARTLYLLPGTAPVDLREDLQNTLHFNTLQTDLALVRNRPDYYLKNTFSLTATHDAQTGRLSRNTAPLAVEQYAVNPYRALSNRLGLVRPLGPRLIGQLTSVVSYDASPQQLDVRPGPLAFALRPDSLPYDAARQRARLAGLFAHNALTLITQRGFWSYSAAVGFWQHWQQLTSDLQTWPTAETSPLVPLRNHLRGNRGRYYTELGVSYRHERTTLRAELPLSYWRLTANDAPLGGYQLQRAVVAEPSLSGRRDLSGRWHVTASTGLSTRFAGFEQLGYAYLLPDYRTLRRNPAPLNRARLWNSTLGAYYEDPLTSLFYHVTYTYARTTNSLLYRQHVQPNGALLTEALPTANQQTAQTAAAQVSKFVGVVRTTLTAQLRASRSQQPQLLNDKRAEVETQTAAATIKATTSAVEWCTLDYYGTLTALRSRVAQSPAVPASWLHEHHAGLTFFAGKHQLLLNADWYATRGPGTRVRATFADATYRYTLPTARKVDLEIRGSNLLNAHQYQYVYLNEFVLVQSRYALRPRQVLASVRVSL